MKLKIGIVGPDVLVQDILEVTNEFPEAKAVPIIYESEQQSSKLIAELNEFIDLYIFSGPAPYYLSLQALPSDGSSLFIPFEGTDIFSVLMRIYEYYHFFPVISFDVIDPKHLQEAYAEIGISDIPRFVKNMEGYWDSEELFNHHLQLWKERKVQVIATCLHSVYERFKCMKILVFLVKHTKQTIRETLKRAILIGLQQKKSDAQITVLQFQTDKQGEELAEIRQRLLDYGNKLFSGSGIIGENTITLYTTRGVLEKVTNHGKDFAILNDIQAEYSCTVNLGIGMGNTVESAAYNARKALMFAVRNGGNCGFLIDDEKRVYGPLGTEHSLEYSLANAEDGSFVSITLRKFYAWLTMMKKNRVTSREISIGMNMSDRHATRILKMLSEKGVAEIVGKESMNQKGRPRPIYEIDLVKLAGEVQERSP